jgi:hypothetical protein
VSAPARDGRLSGACIFALGRKDTGVDSNIAVFLLLLYILLYFYCHANAPFYPDISLGVMFHP